MVKAQLPKAAKNATFKTQSSRMLERWQSCINKNTSVLGHTDWRGKKLIGNKLRPIDPESLEKDTFAN